MERLNDSSVIRQVCDSKENCNSFSDSSQGAKNMLCEAMSIFSVFFGGGIHAVYSEFWH